MPRLRVIFLAATPDDPTQNTWQAALWADVPVSRQSFYADLWNTGYPTARNSAWSGATATDNTNLQNGVMVEQVITQRVQPGTNISQIEAFLQAAWQNYQNQITNNNPWVRYGSTWDGTSWNIATVA